MDDTATHLATQWFPVSESRRRHTSASKRLAKPAATGTRRRAGGATSLHAIAALNARKVPTASGRGEWRPVQVRRVLARM